MTSAAKTSPVMPSKAGCETSTTTSSQLSMPSDAAPSSDPKHRRVLAEMTPRASLPAAGDSFELPQFLERIDADVRVRADAQPDAALAHRLDAEEAVAEVRLGRRADADPGAAVGHQVELGVVGVCGVDDGGARAEAPGSGEELDGPDSVLGEALFDLARLLVGVDVEDELLLVGVASDRLEPVRRAGADGVGGNADRQATRAQVVDLAEVSSTEA